MRLHAAALFLATSFAVLAQSPTVPLGSVVDAGFVDLRWQPRRLHELAPAPAIVVYFATLDCPLVQRYLPRLGRLARDYEPQGVPVVIANVGSRDAFVDAVAQVAAAAPAALFAKDEAFELMRACGVDRTGAAVVLDADRRLVYRGRIDDQHGFAGARPEPRRNDLRAALDQVLAGGEVEVPETPWAGCKVTVEPAATGAAAPHYGDVSPLIARHCASCHRPGGEAPFPLLEQRHAQKHAAMIAEVVENHRMPPWYGASAHGSFVNRPPITAAERELLGAWVRGGALPAPAEAAAEEPAAAPRASAQPAGEQPTDERPWRIGEPDLVLSLKAPVRLPADGVVPYRYFVLPYHFAHDTWVEALEIRPQNERVLHHCNLARVELGKPFTQDGFITGYVPGGDPMQLDPGTAVRIPQGSALALQAHYVTTGEPEVDRIEVGLRFPRQRVQHELQVAIVTNTRFVIPPGARAHPVEARRKLLRDAVGIGLFVHMHLRGRDMQVTAEAPDGGRETLLLVPNYNFDWQQSYRFPPGERTFAAGTGIHALAHFDNSAWNPFNPDPQQAVRFGEQTTDEMMYAFLFWVARDEALDLVVDPANGRAIGE